jgi:hypothetical protein
MPAWFNTTGLSEFWIQVTVPVTGGMGTSDRFIFRQNMLQ